MNKEKITIKVLVLAEKQKVWDFYTKPEHIVNWNFADSSWHCPSAANDLKVGGRYIARMEAKDGSYGFDFEATYTDIKEFDNLTYEFAGRIADVNFKDNNGNTEVTVTFDPETENSIELQKNGWQSILNNFKKYTETN